MTAWPPEDLKQIAATDDLHIAPSRSDGVTYGTPTWIWSVVVGPDLYVRAYNGTRSSWYQAARARRAGRVVAAGREREVDFILLEPSDPELTDVIDQAYRTKYAGSAYLEPMISSRAKAATVRIEPRSTPATMPEQTFDDSGDPEPQA